MKKTYSDFMLNEAETSTVIAPSVTKKEDTSNNTTSTNTIKPDESGEEKTDEQSPDETKKNDDTPDTVSSSFDNIKGEEIIKEIHDFWTNKIITENELNFSGNTLKILYVKQKNSKYTKYKERINEVINDKTADCQKRLDDSEVGDLFFYNEYPVKLEKKGLGGKPSIISFFERKNDENYNSKIKEIINSKDYVDSSKLKAFEKGLRLDEFELLTDIDENQTYLYDEQPVEFTFENHAIKTMVNADTNQSISLVDKNNDPIFDITKLKIYNESNKSNNTTTTTTTDSQKLTLVKNPGTGTSGASTVATGTSGTSTVEPGTSGTSTVAPGTSGVSKGTSGTSTVEAGTSGVSKGTSGTSTVTNSDNPHVMSSKEFKNSETLRRAKNKHQN